MATSFAADMNAHVEWLKNAYTSSSYYHWIVCEADRGIGLIAISGMDLEAGKTSWGYYLAEITNPAIGGMVPAYFYNFIFDHFPQIQEVHAEVLERNKRVCRLHEVFGYVRTPDFDSEITKNGITERLLALKLTRECWMGQEKYRGLKTEFPMAHWIGEPKGAA